MFVNVLLIVISGFFAARELNLIAKVDNSTSQLKTLGYQIIAFLFLFLSIINAYNDRQDELELLSTAKMTLKRTDELNIGLSNNLKTIETTRNQIVALDSVLDSVKISTKSQLSLLENAVKESEKLVELESRAFNSKRPFIKINTNDLKLVFDSISNYYYLKYSLKNSGYRTASRIIMYDAIFSLNQGETIKYLSGSPSRFFESLFPEEDVKTWKHKTKITKANLSNPNQTLLVVIKLLYFDDVAKLGHTQMLLFRSLNNNMLEFGLEQFKDRVLILKHMRNNKSDFSGFLIDDVEYQPNIPVK